MVSYSFLIYLLVFTSLNCANKEQQAQKHYKRGFKFHNQGSLDQAMDEYQKALKLNPNFVEVYMNLGAIYVDQKDFTQAIQQFKKAIEINYYNGKAHYNLGLVYVYAGEKEKAKEELKILRNFGSGLADNLEMKIAE